MTNILNKMNFAQLPDSYAKHTPFWAPQKLMDTFAYCIKHAEFYKINNALRTDFSETIYINADIRALDELFEIIPSELKNTTPITVYRGTKLTKELSEILQGKSSKDIFTDKAYVFTSSDINIAKLYATHSDNVLFQIELPPNSTYITASMLPNSIAKDMKGQKEILLPRNAQFQIISYDAKSKTVKAKYIGQKQPLTTPGVMAPLKYDYTTFLNKCEIENSGKLHDFGFKNNKTT